MDVALSDLASKLYISVLSFNGSASFLAVGRLAFCSMRIPWVAK
jgi:hypothetical protein